MNTTTNTFENTGNTSSEDQPHAFEIVIDGKDGFTINGRPSRVDSFFDKKENFKAYEISPEKFPTLSFDLKISDNDKSLAERFASLLYNIEQPMTEDYKRLMVRYRNGNIGFYKNVSDDTLKMLQRYIDAGNRLPRKWQRRFDTATQVVRCWPVSIGNAEIKTDDTTHIVQNAQFMYEERNDAKR